MRIALSAGHGKYIRGAAGPSPWGLDEVDEARRVCTAVADALTRAGHHVDGPFFDDVSTTQDANLKWLVNKHNACTRDLDVSVHFNCFDETAYGTEVLYVTQEDVAEEVSDAIANAGGFADRGPKHRDDLYFLNNTEMPAVLIETCFCDNQGDCHKYDENFDAICAAIAASLTSGEQPEPAPEPEPDGVLFQASGPCSWFGGPQDTGVSPSEDLAWLETWDQVCDAGLQDYFLPTQPPGTTGLARRLDPEAFYVAVRWNYNDTPKSMLADKSKKALVRSNSGEILCQPMDWGPHADTHRIADLSPGAMDELRVTTDDRVEVLYPAPVGPSPEPEPEPEAAVVRIETSGPVTVIIDGVKVQ